MTVADGFAGLVGAVALPVAGVVVGATQIVRGVANTPSAIKQARAAGAGVTALQSCSHRPNAFRRHTMTYQSGRGDRGFNWMSHICRVHAMHVALFWAALWCAQQTWTLHRVFMTVKQAPFLSQLMSSEHRHCQIRLACLLLVFCVLMLPTRRSGRPARARAGTTASGCGWTAPAPRWRWTTRPSSAFGSSGTPAP